MAHRVKAVPVAENVYWVGAIDWTVRDFHGYLTSRGTTYNAYLIVDEKITLVDAVKRPFCDEMLSRIASVVDPAQVEIIVSNHSEPDHSGGLQRALAACRPERLIASTLGAKTLARLYAFDQEIQAVKDGETLNLGAYDLTFLETKMLHWPDSMFSYLTQLDLLFSQDAFGMHLASSERFDDEVDDWVLESEAAKYYANILTPLSPLVLKLLERVGSMNLGLKMIAPDHGPIWRTDLGRIVDLYAHWAAQKPTSKAVIVYDTMWGATEKMAQAYAEGLQAGGACVRVMPLHSCHRSDIASELLEAGALLVGSPTINNQMFPTVADLLTYVRGLKRQNLLGTAFGAYGWSGEAVGQMTDILTDMRVEIAAEPIKTNYAPDGAVLEECFAAGRQIGERLSAYCGCRIE
jgi:flavorubredoxin